MKNEIEMSGVNQCDSMAILSMNSFLTYLKGVKLGDNLGTITQEVGPLVGKITTLKAKSRADGVVVIHLVINGQRGILISMRVMKESIGLARLDFLS